MAEIIYEPKQVEALHEIQDALDQLWKINIIISEGVSQFSLLADSSHGSLNIPIDEKDSSKLLSILLAQQNKLLKSIAIKAEKYHISFDKIDTQIMRGEAPEKKKRKKKPSDP